MDNYKIEVKDEAESKEAQELFFELGYSWVGNLKDVRNTDHLGYLCAHMVSDIPLIQMACGKENAKELTLPQLRDLVVLKRNDVKDANWETEGGDQIFKDSNDKSYIYRADGWDELQRHEMRQAMWEKPKAIAKPQYLALISGAEALRALADGKEVELLDEELDIPWTKILTEKDERNAIEPCISMFFDGYREIKFRLKPQTIKLELELPKPFEPKRGEIYWFVDSTEKDGYLSVPFHDDKDDHKYVQFGAYRTEAEVKQVVEQLKKIRGAT